MQPRRQHNPFLVMLLVQQLQRLHTRPPVTLALLATMGALHYTNAAPNLRDVCLMPAAIVAGHRPLQRLLLSGLLHVDDIHLVCG
jgi:hypothetical protein